jgi:transposase InsO family protein
LIVIACSMTRSLIATRVIERKSTQGEREQRSVEGWLYLAAVIDLHSRHVVGWSMAPHMQTSLVADALRMAWFRRHPGPGLVFHSDRGSQYCSHEFQTVLSGYGMRSSMSRKGNCSTHPPRACGAH